MQKDIRKGVRKIAEKKKKAPSKKAKETYPHFRHYKKSGHPALIISEDGEEKYKFRLSFGYSRLLRPFSC